MSIQNSEAANGEIEGAAVRLGGVAKTGHGQTPKGAWLIVALLFLFMLVNFADKAVIGIAAVPINGRTTPQPARVRVARLELLPVIFNIGGRHRLHRQPG
jgi:hypothetical protein